MGHHFRERDNFVRIVDLTPALRKQIEATIEHLVSILDQFDGDENLEDDGIGEGSLGWTESGPEAKGFASGDCELDSSDEEDGGDHEPSLGFSIEPGIGAANLDPYCRLDSGEDLEFAYDDQGESETGIDERGCYDWINQYADAIRAGGAAA